MAYRNKFQGEWQRAPVLNSLDYTTGIVATGVITHGDINHTQGGYVAGWKIFELWSKIVLALRSSTVLYQLDSFWDTM